MIIWIASYPKSGNTWIRSFIYSLIYSKDLKPDLKKINIIDQYHVKIYAYVSQVGNIKLDNVPDDISRESIDENITRCPQKTLRLY